MKRSPPFVGEEACRVILEVLVGQFQLQNRIHQQQESAPDRPMNIAVRASKEFDNRLTCFPVAATEESHFAKRIEVCCLGFKLAIDISTAALKTPFDRCRKVSQL